jgi:hypothetical protein
MVGLSRILILILLCSTLAFGIVEFQYGHTFPAGYWTDSGGMPGGNYYQVSVFIPNLSDIIDYGLFFQHGILGRYTYVDDDYNKHYFSSNMDIFGLCVRLMILPHKDWYRYFVCEPRGYMYYGGYNQRGVLGEISTGEDIAYTTKEDMLGGAIGLALGGRIYPYGQIAFTVTEYALGPLDPINGPKYDRPTNATIFKTDIGAAIEVWLPEQ